MGSKPVIFLASVGHDRTGNLAAPHAILAHRNAARLSHPRIVEVPCDNHVRATETITKALEGQTNYVVLGGDHVTTLGVLRSQARPFLVMYDAHTDEYTNSSFLDCGNWLTYARNEDLVSGVKLIGCREASGMSSWNTMPIPKAGHIHITVDIDVLDPKEYGYATNYPEPGGMTLDDLTRSLHSLKARCPDVWITADLVEYNPYHDPTRAGAIACSTILDALLFTVNES